MSLSAALVVVALLAMGLVACGGGGDSASTATSPSTRASTTGGSGGQGSQDSQQSGREDSSSGSDNGSQGNGDSHGGGSQLSTAPLRVSGGGSAQFHVKGGDNSVQDYGDEAGESEIRQAAEAVHSFFVTRVRGEWDRACSLLTADEQNSLEQLAAQSQLATRTCAAALAAFTQPVSSSQAREITELDAASLRHEGEQAFLIYVGAPEKTVYAIPLRLEGGVWKLSAISGSALRGIPPG